MKAIVNATLVTSEGIVPNSVILFDSQIVSVGDTLPQEGIAEVIDAQGAYVSAGFIDIHIHGSGGADVMDATPQALETISTTLLRTGTTAFLATTMTMARTKIEAALETVVKVKDTLSGARIIGVHLEGPFINPSKQGAQDAAHIQEATLSWLAPYHEIVRMITLAPEMAGAEAFIRECRARYPQIVLSLGHSEATYAQSMQAFDMGVSHVTHLFNAMLPYHHREPGVVGACFDRDDVTCDLIADMVHTHPHHLRLAWKMKGVRLMLITDAMRAGCMREGTYDLGGQQVSVLEGKAVLDDGTLAGSVLRMNDALRHMRTHTALSLWQVVDLVTKIPAQKLGLRKGRLQKGYNADIVIFDEDFSIITTIVAGEVKYQRSQ